MHGKPKKKLCWNCEGNTSFQDENCPYCGVYLNPSYIDNNDDKNNLFSPPYQVKETEQESQPPSPPYSAEETSKKIKSDHLQEMKKNEAIDEVRMIFTPLLLLLSGTVLFFFGLVLFLFSHNGLLKLTWNGRYWYLYFILAMPILFAGWWALQQLHDENKRK